MGSVRKRGFLFAAAVVVVAIAAAAGAAGGTTAVQTTNETGDAAATIEVQKGDASNPSTIQAAVDMATDGDRIVVQPRDATGNAVVYEESVTVGKNVTIEAAPAQRFLMRPSADGAAFRIVGSAAPAIERVTFRSPNSGSGSGAAINATGAAGDWRLLNSEVRSGYEEPIEARGSTGDWLIDDVTVRRASGAAVDASDTEGSWVVRESRFVATNGSSVAAEDSVGDWRVDRTVFENDPGTGQRGGHVAVETYGSTGDWTVARSTMRDLTQGVLAGQSSGAWRVVRTEFTNLSETAIGAGRGDGSWTVRDVTIDGAEEGVAAVFSTGAWTVRDVTIRNVSTGVNADQAEGAWSVSDTRVLNASAFGVEAFESSGNWTVRNATIRASGSGTALRTSESTGSWTVSDSVLVTDPGSLVVDAFDSTGGIEITDSVLHGGGLYVSGQGYSIDRVRLEVAGKRSNVQFLGPGTIDGLQAVNVTNKFELEDATLRRSTISGSDQVQSSVNEIDASGSFRIVDTRITGLDGEGVYVNTGERWSIVDATIEDSGGDGIYIDREGPQWRIVDATVTGSGENGILNNAGTAGRVLGAELRNNSEFGAYAVSGNFSITDSVVTDNGQGGVFGNVLEVDATGNWWGQPTGPAPDQCQGEVDCSNPLRVAPPRAASVTGAVTNASGAPITNASVYVFPANSLFAGEEPIARQLIGRERIEPRERALLAGATASTRTDGDGEYTIRGLDPLFPQQVSLIVVPPGGSPGNVRQVGPFPLTEGQTAREDVRLDSDSFLDPLDDDVAAVRQAARDAINASQRDAARTYVEGGRFMLSNTEVSATPGAFTIIGAFADAATPSAGDVAQRGLRKAITDQLAKETAENVLKGAAKSTGKRSLEAQLFQAYVDRWNSFAEDQADGNGTGYSDMQEYYQRISRTGWLTNFRAGAGGPKLNATGLTEDEAVNLSIENGYDGMPAETEAQAAIDQSAAEYQAIAQQRPAENFSFTYAASVLRAQRDALRGSGLVTGLVITPQGDFRAVRTAQSHRSDYLAARAEFEKFKTAQKVFSVSSTVGDVVQFGGYLLAAPTGGVSAAVGSAINTVATAGEYTARVQKLLVVNKLYDRFAQTQVHHLRDLDRIAAANNDTVDWLRAETQNPSIGGGVIQSVDLNADLEVDSGGSVRRYVEANLPEDCGRTTGIPCVYAQEDATVTVANPGDEPTEVRLVLVTYPIATGGVDLTGASGSGSPAPGDVVTVFPGQETQPAVIPAGGTRTFTLPYAAEYARLQGDYSVVAVGLWADDRVTDQVSRVVQPVGEAELSEKRQTVGGNANAPDSSRSTGFAFGSSGGSAAAARPAGLDTASRTVLDRTLTPGNASAAATVSTGSNVATVSYLLFAPPTVNVTLRVTDTDGRTTGYDPATDGRIAEVPESAYSGAGGPIQTVTIRNASNRTFTVALNATFDSSADAGVTLVETTVPDRPPILSLEAAEDVVLLGPNDTQSATAAVAETGGQEPLTGLNVTLTNLTAPDGRTLSEAVGNVTFDAAPATLDPAAVASLALNVTVGDTSGLSLGDPTRFEGTVTATADGVGTASVNVSALVLDSTVANASLLGADSTVTGVHLERLARTAVVPPGNRTVYDAYRLTGQGSGNVTLSLPTAAPNLSVAAYRTVNGTYERVPSNASAGRVTVTVPPDTGDIVISEPVTAPTLPGAVGPAADVDGDGRLEDVDGDGSADVFDAIALYNNRNAQAVRDNPQLFDFDGNGDVDVFDAIELYNEVA